ncbi:MAG: hypothetical protein ACPGR2_05735 [Psychrobium sp.]
MVIVYKKLPTIALEKIQKMNEPAIKNIVSGKNPSKESAILPSTKELIVRIVPVITDPITQENKLLR